MDRHTPKNAKKRKEKEAEMSKKWIVIIVLVLLSIVLASCGKEEGREEDLPTLRIGSISDGKLLYPVDESPGGPRLAEAGETVTFEVILLSGRPLIRVFEIERNGTKIPVDIRLDSKVVVHEETGVLVSRLIDYQSAEPKAVPAETAVTAIEPTKTPTPEPTKTSEPEPTKKMKTNAVEYVDVTHAQERGPTQWLIIFLCVLLVYNVFGEAAQREQIWDAIVSFAAAVFTLLVMRFTWTNMLFSLLNANEGGIWIVLISLSVCLVVAAADGWDFSPFANYLAFLVSGALVLGHLGELGYTIGVKADGLRTIVNQYGLANLITQKLSVQNLNILVLVVIILAWVILFWDMIRKPKNNMMSLGILIGGPLVFALAKVMLVDVFTQSAWWSMLIFIAVFGGSGWFLRGQKSKTGGERDSITGLILGAFAVLLFLG